MGSFLTKIFAAFLDWIEAELEQMNRRTRKLMTIHQPLNLKSDAVRIYL